MNSPVGRKAISRWWCLAVLLLFPLAVLADGLVIDKIYHPYVQPLEQELEGRISLQDRQPGQPDDLGLYRLAYGRAFGERWFGEIYLVGQSSDDQSFEISGYELEAMRQLTEQGEYWADFGVLFELEKQDGLDIWEFSTGLLAEKEWGQWSGTANLFVSQEWGDDIEDELESALGLQARYRYSRALEPAIELYKGDGTFALGPALMGEIRLAGKQKLAWETGAIFGLDSESPNLTWRFLLEFEF
ncbi:MAG TPA: hypothetical protein VFG52_05025 [Xanthomonadales bacterium]|nr:hypothetical protein [Xanthomonadales bacterium]